MRESSAHTIQDSHIRRGHPIFFGLLMFFSFIEGVTPPGSVSRPHMTSGDIVLMRHSFPVQHVVSFCLSLAKGSGYNVSWK